jgi:hypothetical protein
MFSGESRKDMSLGAWREGASVRARLIDIAVGMIGPFLIFYSGKAEAKFSKIIRFA